VTEKFDVDVVVAGGGPVGMVLAAELRLSRVDVTVLERLAEASPHSKAFGLQARSLEMLDRRGLLEKFREGARSWNNGHFAGLDRWVDFSVLESDQAYSLLVPQARTERLLEARAVEAGADIRRGHELTAVDQDDDGVTVTVRGPEGPYRIRARYLVGADGGRSIVRKAVGIGFPGTGGRVTTRMGDVRLSGEDEAPMGMERTDRGLIFSVPLEDGYQRIATFDYGAPRDTSAELTIDELSASMRAIWGTDYGMHDATWLSSFTDSARLADTYRAARVFLAGDAAHVHFPVGAQGLNLGLQDAFNLGWKLAAQVHGGAPAGLLDTYDAERRGPAASVLANTSAQIALMDPHPDVTPLRALFTELLGLDQVNHRIAATLAGVEVRYELPGTPHRLLGDFARDIEVKGPDGDVRLAELLRRGSGVLLDLGGLPEMAEAAGAWAVDNGRAGGVRLTAGVTKDEPDLAGLLVRPDGYVVWAADTDADPAELRDGLAAALRRWFAGPR
jgi:3-(3-hydroxy-phenyl)propionate hydroxylase/monooxygenase